MSTSPSRTVIFIQHRHVGNLCQKTRKISVAKVRGTTTVLSCRPTNQHININKTEEYPRSHISMELTILNNNDLATTPPRVNIHHPNATRERGISFQSKL